MPHAFDLVAEMLRPAAAISTMPSISPAIPTPDPPPETWIDTSAAVHTARR